jgi:hypothetical protein
VEALLKTFHSQVMESIVDAAKEVCQRYPGMDAAGNPNFHSKLPTWTQPNVSLDGKKLSGWKRSAGLQDLAAVQRYPEYVQQLLRFAAKRCGEKLGVPAATLLVTAQEICTFVNHCDATERLVLAVLQFAVHWVLNRCTFQKSTDSQLVGCEAPRSANALVVLGLAVTQPTQEHVDNLRAAVNHYGSAVFVFQARTRAKEKKVILPSKLLDLLQRPSAISIDTLAVASSGPDDNAAAAAAGSSDSDDSSVGGSGATAGASSFSFDSDDDDDGDDEDCYSVSSGHHPAPSGSAAAASSSRSHPRSRASSLRMPTDERKSLYGDHLDGDDENCYSATAATTRLPPALLQPLAAACSVAVAILCRPPTRAARQLVAWNSTPITSARYARTLTATTAAETARSRRWLLPVGLLLLLLTDCSLCRLQH